MRRIRAVTTCNFTYSNRLIQLQSNGCNFLVIDHIQRIFNHKHHKRIFQKLNIVNFLEKYLKSIFSSATVRCVIQQKTMSRAVRFPCLRMKLIFTPLSSALDNFFDIKRFFLKAVTAVGGPLLRWITCYVKRAPSHYSASNLVLYFFSLVLNSFVYTFRMIIEINGLAISSFSNNS